MHKLVEVNMTLVNSRCPRCCGQLGTLAGGVRTRDDAMKPGK